jgi:thymidylate kinase
MKGKKEFFQDIVKKFNEQRIRYTFLRGHEFFFNKDNCGEIDILIRKKDLNKLKKMFQKIKNAHQFKNNIDLTHAFLIRIVEEGFIVDFDFQIKGIGYCGSEILKEDYLLKHSRKEKFYTVLDDETRFLMLFVHGFVFKKRLEYFKKYKEEFFKLWNKIDKKKISKVMSSLFNIRISKEIIDLIEKKDLENLFNLRKKLVKIHLLKNPLRIFPIIISKSRRFRNYFHLDRFFYFINPFKWAPLISFIGSDGSGKSTLTKRTKEYLDKFKIRNKILSGGVFSSIKNPFKKKIINESYSKKVIDSSKKPKSSELLLRYLLQIPKQLKILYYRKKGILVISDRYSYDLITFYGAKGIIKWGVKLFQKPTKCFYVKVSQEIISKRNKDLNSEAIKKVVSNIEKNQRCLSLIELKNENFNFSQQKLKKHLSEVIKNV